ncbi:hypothetical protein HGA88_04240 [Candidatus Roizmanbacteria bacterium]|nr:hypothetical protein [Candidatus Roizmanbacteria bacterium]
MSEEDIQHHNKNEMPIGQTSAGETIFLAFEEDDSPSLYEQIYGKDIIAEMAIHPGETSEQYKERVQALHPQESQKNLIEATFLVTRASEFSMDATSAYLNKTVLSPSIAGMFPPELNTNIQKIGPNAFYLQMNREEANAIIRACNISALQVKLHGDQIVSDIQKSTLKVLLGEEKLQGLHLKGSLQQKTALLRVTIAQKLLAVQLGDKTANELVTQIISDLVQKEITHNSLGLNTNDTSQLLTQVSKMIGLPFSVIELAGESIRLAIGLEEFHIPSIIFSNIKELLFQETHPKT